MECKYLTMKKENQTLWIGINNPPVNFLIMDVLEELFILLKKVRKDDSIRVLVLTGARDDIYIMHYSIPELLRLSTHNRRLLLHIAVKFRLTGAMLALLMTFNNWLMDYFSWYEWVLLKFAKLIRRYSSGMFLWFQMMRTYHAIERLNKVTIAAINGSCNGGGTELSACCDFRFMIGDQGFTIGQPECLVGIVPGGGGSQRLPRLIGRAKALEFMLKGNQLNPQEARRIGLVTDYFKKKEFRNKVQEFADAMSKRPPVGIDAIKKSVRNGMNTTLRHGLSLELEQSVRCLDTRDARMAMEEYVRYIDANILSQDMSRSKTGDIADMVKKTTDTLEKAEIFREFEGR